MDLNIENLIYSSSGVGGLAYLGVNKALEEYGILKKVQNFAGSSGGGIIAGFAACRINSNDLIDYVLNSNMNELMDGLNVPFGSEISFVRVQGMYKGEKLYEWVKRGYCQLLGYGNINFQDVTDMFGTTISMTVSNITDSCVEYYSSYKTPDVELAFGSRVTSSIPVFYEPIKIDNVCYVDGGYFLSYPVNLFENKLDKTMGIKITGNVKATFNQNESAIYMYQLLSSSSVLLNKLQGVENSNEIKLEIPVDINIFDFSISSKQKSCLINTGYDLTVQQIKKGLHR